MVNEVRGHHLASLAYAVHTTGKIPNYANETFNDRIKITSSLDDECRKCPVQQDYCDTRFQRIDKTVANVFGLEIGKEYDPQDVRSRIEAANLDDGVMRLVLSVQQGLY